MLFVSLFFLKFFRKLKIRSRPAAQFSILYSHENSKKNRVRRIDFIRFSIIQEWVAASLVLSLRNSGSNAEFLEIEWE